PLRHTPPVDEGGCARSLSSKQRFEAGGEGGIRTHVPITGQDAFEAPPLRPLRYLSVRPDRVKADFLLYVAFVPVTGGEREHAGSRARRIRVERSATLRLMPPRRRHNRSRRATTSPATAWARRSPR